MIQYKVSSRKLAIGAKKGQTLYFAQPIAQDKITTSIVEERIVNMTSLSVSDVRASIAALAQVVREEMFSGRSVDLGDLGSFKVVSTSRMVDTEKAVNANLLRTPQIRFYPRQQMKDRAKAVSRLVVRDGMRPDANLSAKPSPSGEASGSETLSSGSGRTGL